VLASKAHIDATAAALRDGGVAGSLRQLRVLAYLDLTQGRNPLDRIGRPAGKTANDPRPAGPPARDADADETAGGHRDGDADAGEAGSNDSHPDHDPGTAATDGDGDPGQPGDGGQRNGTTAGTAGSTGGGLDDDPYAEDRNYADDGPGGPAAPARDPAPFPALVNLTIPAATILGFSDAPGDIAGWGLADSADARRLARAAARHPATRWCITITGPDGTAVAHGCARGPHPWIPPPSPAPPAPAGPGPGQPPSGGGSRGGPATRAGPDPGQAAALAGLLRRLNLTLHPIARGSCEHRHREDRYTPSRTLKHLIRARTATCPAPGCGAHACHNDIDHTLAYPAGPTDECNLAPPCRRHHRAKQAPGWQLSQPEPGVMRWTTPSGRIHTTTPTIYET
jgi:hypothetical protein